MKRSVCGLAVILAFAASNAMAACTGPFMTASAIQALLANNTACVGHTPAAEWSEWHNGAASGNVVDWKKGANDPSDPAKTVGTYLIKTSPTAGVVTYTYTSGGSYTYYVSQGSTSPYTFCNTSGSPIFAVTINPGQGPC